MNYANAGRLSVCLSAMLLLGCAGEAMTETDVIVQEVINGTNVGSTNNPGVAALYHQTICESGSGCSVGSFYWFPRPCSSTILRAWKNETWLLTARHCVTTNGAVDGTPVSAARIAVNASLNPGIAAPNPPLGSVAADRVVAPTIPAGTSETALTGYDYALVHVPQVLTAPAIKPSLDMQAKDKLDGLQGYGYGYGRYADWPKNGEIEDGSSGAGRLRVGGPFSITAECDKGPISCGLAGWYQYFNMTSTTGQQLWRGDSGGPTFVVRQQSPMIFEQVGIHGSANLTSPYSGYDCQITGIAGFIQSTIGFLHVSPYTNPGLHLTAAGGTVSEGATVRLENGGTSRLGARWVFDAATKRIYVKNAAGTRYFLAGSSHGTPTFGSVTLRTAPGSPYGTWDLDRGRLVMNGEWCLEARSDGTVRTGSCGFGAAQRWAWHAQP